MANNQYGDVSLNLNGYVINGVKTLALTQSQVTIPVRHMGGISTYREFAVPAQSRLSYSQYSFYNDPFFTYATGGIPTSGGIYRDGYTTLFKSGLIESYRVAGQIGDFPESNIDILVLGDLYTGKANVYPFGKNIYPNHSIIYPKDIEISGLHTGTNYINKFEYQISIPNEIVYYNNKWGVGDHIIVRPLTASLTITMDSIDYKTSGFHNYISNRPMYDFNIILRDCNKDQISIYPLKSGILTNENYEIKINDRETVTLTYEGFVDVI